MEIHAYFGIWDYLVLGGMLLLSVLIGVYFAFFAKIKQNTTLEYLMGGKTMGVFPISMSLTASYLSAFTVIGNPSEIYTFGTQICISHIGEICSIVALIILYIPVFYNLQVTSSYEYLNKRFSHSVRTVGSALFLCKMLLFIPIVIYIQALTFSQVSGFSINVLIPVVSIVCIFYTTLGGMKAVVWTDTLQMFVMGLGVVATAILGTYDVGGFQKVWETNRRGDRIDFFNMSWDPTIRHTFWNVLFGKFFMFLAHCTIDQSIVQRCLALSTLKKARSSIVIFYVGYISIATLSFYMGLVIYAAFFDCDPVTAGIVNKSDQILPYYVMRVTSHIPVFPGIFISGVVSASISTFSTGLNSCSAIILEDLIKPFHKMPLTEDRASFYVKVSTVVCGVVCLLMALVVDKLGPIVQVSKLPLIKVLKFYIPTSFREKYVFHRTWFSLYMPNRINIAGNENVKKSGPFGNGDEKESKWQTDIIIIVIILAISVVQIGVCGAIVLEHDHKHVKVRDIAVGSLYGITSGTLFGMFTLGMLFPWANAKGAIAGGICSVLFVGWISVGSQLAASNKQIVFPKKPMAIDGCDNATLQHYHSISMENLFPNNDINRDEPFVLYTVSYMYYAAIGMVIVIVVGIIVSYFTKFNDPMEIDPNLLSPVIHRFLLPRLNSKRIKQKHHGVIAPIAKAQKRPLLTNEPTEDISLK